MKIVVIGTSNSVKGNKGFIEALRLNHEVIQLSSGRNPFFYHIRTIENNRDIIKSCDLLIIDHYVNDVNFYRNSLGIEYENICKIFYRYLNSLNIYVLNLLFPIKDIQKRETRIYYDFILNLSRANFISVIDLNCYDFPPHYYEDSIHITNDVSYIFGLFLGDLLIDILIDQKLEPDTSFINPFSLINLSSIYTSNLANIYCNKLVNIKYIDVQETFLIKIAETSRLLSIGYLKPKEMKGECGVVLNKNHIFGLSDIGYFHEALDFKIYGDICVTPVYGNNLSIENLMRRGTSEGDFTYCYLVDILILNEICEDSPKNKKVFLFDLSNMMKALNRLLPHGRIIDFNTQAKTIDFIRDIAIFMENRDIVIAKELMLIAHFLRPHGSFIKDKLNNYISLIKK